jgi:RNA polymerase sigma factor (sigma-70 family)
MQRLQSEEMKYARIALSRRSEATLSERNRMDEARKTRLAERMRWREMTDAELVAAVRRGSYEALREFYARFEPLLARYAARARVMSDSWEDDAHDVLSGVVLTLVEQSGRARARESVRDIHAYIQRAFRNHFLDAKRSAMRREQRDTRATSSAEETGERMALASCSESSVRASSGETSGESTAPSPAIVRLAAILDAELSPDERQMLTWVSNAVPMREIAKWMEIGYSAAKVRLSRTRSRLRERALRHVNECTGPEREELIELFRRSGGIGRGMRERSARGIAASREPCAAEPGGAHGTD